jgi:hypothetical protein
MNFIETASNLLTVCGGFFGSVGTAATKRWSVDPRGLKTLRPSPLAEGLPPPEWVTLLGSEYVALVGEEKLRRAPCEVVRKLDDGSYVLLLARDLSDLERSAELLASKRAALVEHLGQDYFADSESPTSKKILSEFARTKP